MAFGRRESGTRVMRLGAERREAVQGMRRKGSLESEGAMVDFRIGEVCLRGVFVFLSICFLWNCGVGGFARLPVSGMEPADENTQTSVGYVNSV